MLPHDKRKMLLSKKQDLLQEIEFYERKIALERRKNMETVLFEDEYDDSDSDPGFHIQSKLDHQTEAQLENESRQLSICLQATQELTRLEIIQSEEEVLVEPPELETSVLPSEAGDWSEVMAECRVDRVHFSMTFYVHQPHRKFSAPSFHGMRVKIVKSAHEKELDGSLLGHVKRPSDVVQLLKSYAAALRSRRNTLTNLNERFGDRITLELAPSGGYLLKCAGLLQLTWSLECNKSILANFQHFIKCELEYIEPHHLKLISASHKKLSDPTLSTEDRTLLVSDIISKCLQVAGINESSAQDTDMDTTAQSENQIAEPAVMAPPKQLPKRAKSKSSTGIESTKRDNEDTREIDRNDRKRKVDNEMGGEKKDFAKENQKTLKTNDNKKVNPKEIASEKILDVGSKEVPVKKPKALKDKSNIVKNVLANDLMKHKESNAKNVEKNEPKNNEKEKKITKDVDRENTQAKKVVNEPTKGVNDQKKVKDTDKNKTKNGVDTEKNKDTKQKEVEVKSSRDIVNTKTSNMQSKNNDDQRTNDNKIKQNSEKAMKKQENKLTARSEPKHINTEKNNYEKPIKSFPNQKHNTKTSIPAEKNTKVASIKNKPQVDKTKAVATSQNENDLKNTDQTKKPSKPENKNTNEAKKNKLTFTKLTDKIKQSKDLELVSKIPKPVHTKIPIKIPNKKRSSKELTPKSKSSMMKPKLKNNQNKAHLITKPASSITKAVEHQLAVTSTPINAARLAKKSSVKKV